MFLKSDRNSTYDLRNIPLSEVFGRFGSPMGACYGPLLDSGGWGLFYGPYWVYGTYVVRITVHHALPPGLPKCPKMMRYLCVSCIYTYVYLYIVCIHRMYIFHFDYTPSKFGFWLVLTCDGRLPRGKCNVSGKVEKAGLLLGNLHQVAITVFSASGRTLNLLGFLTWSL